MLVSHPGLHSLLHVQHKTAPLESFIIVIVTIIIIAVIAYITAATAQQEVSMLMLKEC